MGGHVENRAALWELTHAQHNPFRFRIDADSLDVVSIQDLEEAMSRKKLSSFLESMGISTEEPRNAGVLRRFQAT